MTTTDTQRIFLVDIDAYNPTTGLIETLRYDTHGVSGDDGGFIQYIPKVNISGLPNLEVGIFQNGRVTGVSDIGGGSVILNNANAELDQYKDFGFDGRDLRIYRMNSISDPLSSRVLFFSGTIETVEFSLYQVRLNIRDRLFTLDTDLQPERFDSSNTLEGSDDTINGDAKPRLFGKVLNIEPVQISYAPNDLIYAVNYNRSGNRDAVASFDDVYISGLSVAGGNKGDFATVAALQAASFPNGWATCIAEGIFRLFLNPQGQVTCDVTGTTTTTGAIVKALLDERGATDTTTPGSGVRYDGGTLTGVGSIDDTSPYTVGLYSDDGRPTSLSFINQFLEGIGAFLVRKRNGILEAGIFDIPSGTPVKDLYWDYELIDNNDGGIQKITSGDVGNGIPAYRVIVDYARFFERQTGGSVAGSVTDERRKRLEKEYLSTNATDTTGGNTATQTYFLTSPELSFITTIVDKTDADTEATRLLGIYGLRRPSNKLPELWRLSVVTDQASDLESNDVIRLFVPNRFDLDGGKLFRIVNVNDDVNDGTTTLEVFA